MQRRRATYEDLMQVPENMVAELIDGEVFASPRPAIPHALAASAIGGRLFDRFNGPRGGGADAPGGWWILYEPELLLGDDVLVPDIGGWRRERVPVLDRVPAMPMAPDWVCEVVSPSTGRLDRVRKLPVYAREGVGHVWLVDPTPETLEVYRLETGRWVLLQSFAGSAVVRAEPFDAVDIDMQRWWIEP